MLWGEVTDIVFTAGIYLGQQFEDLTQESMERCWKVNCLGFVNTVQAWQQESSKQSPEVRKIVAVTSAAARLRGSDVAYAASKAALESCVVTMARTLARKNILVCGVAPGIIESQMAKAVSIERYQAHEKANLLQRAAYPAEIAAVIRWLLESPVPLMTGSVIDASAGTTLR